MPHRNTEHTPGTSKRSRAACDTRSILSGGITAVVAAGGQSRRFGLDKATYVLDGEMMADRAVRLAGHLAEEVVLGLPEVAESRPSGWVELEGRHRVLYDDPGGIGPIGSLHAALRGSTTEWVLFLACDLPGLASTHLSALAAARSPGALAVVSVDSTGRRHPTVALYHRDLLPRVEEALAAGRHALWRLLQGPETLEVVLPDEALLNMNRRSQLPPSEDAS